MRISAVICTHNRASFLRKALQSLCEQTLDSAEYEVIVVDNASTDETKLVVSEFAGVCRGMTVRYLYDPVLGLSHARNTGWQNANAALIAYMDDDAASAVDWLGNIVRFFDNAEEKAACVGGRVELEWESPRPEWLGDALLGDIGYINWGRAVIKTEPHQYIAGLNMAFRKNALQSIGGFSTKIGQKGGLQNTMDDIYVENRLRAAGYFLFYDPSIMVRHYISGERLNKKWFLTRSYGKGVSSANINTHAGQYPVFLRIVKGLSTLIRILTSPKDMSSLVLSNGDTERFIKKCSVYARLGHVAALWGLAR